MLPTQRRWLYSGLVVLACGGLALFHNQLLALLVAAPHGTLSVAVGDKVPDFTVIDVEGKAWKLSDLQKRTVSGVVSLTFWCTFCHSCRMMDARFQKVAEEFKDKASILGIDASAADTAKRVEAFAREKNFSVAVFMDADGKIANLFGIRLTTTTVVIDKAGVLRYRGQFGVEESPHAQNALRAVLDGQEVAVKETAPAG